MRRSLLVLLLVCSSGCTLVLSSTPCDTAAPPTGPEDDTARDTAPPDDTSTPDDTAAPSPRTATALTAGGLHTCAVDSDGTTDCWGLDGETGTATAPAELFEQPRLSAGYRFTCALPETGTATPICWGDDSNGQSSPDGSYTGLLAAGGAHACATTEAGGVECWGRTIEDQTEPPEAIQAAASIALLASGWLFSCAQADPASGPVCWGYDDVGQVSTAPRTPLLAMALGQGFGAGIDATTGQTVCWGREDLCDQIPSEPAADAAWVELVAGVDFVCARTDAGDVTCWGSNENGVLTDVPDTTFRAVSAGPGGRHVCGILDDGDDTVACWGLDASGQASP